MNAVQRLIKPSILVAIVIVLVVCRVSVHAQGQRHQHGHVVLPNSSIERAEDAGKHAHTNHLIFFPDKHPSAPTPDLTSLAGGETPQSLRAVYNLPPSGGSGVIVIVDAYHYPTALNDFNTFSYAIWFADLSNGRLFQRGIPEWQAAAHRLCLVTRSSTRYRVGTRDGADGKHRPR